MPRSGRNKTGRWKPCDKCAKPFYCIPAHDVGGSLRLKRFCSNACYHGDRRAPVKREAIFWSHVNKTDGCWLYGGTLSFEGYGYVNIGSGERRQQWQAHRYAWKLLKGDISADKCLLHKCDVRNCVNPEHLYLGDRLDNARDTISRGRKNHGYMPVDQLLWPKLSRRKPKRDAASSAARDAVKETK